MNGSISSISMDWETPVKKITHSEQYMSQLYDIIKVENTKTQIFYKEGHFTGSK